MRYMMSLSEVERNFLNKAKEKCNANNVFVFPEMGVSSDDYEKVTRSLEEKGYVESYGNYVVDSFRITDSGLKA